MRPILIPLLLIPLGFFVPLLLGRVMSGVSIWVWRLVACAICTAGFAVLLLSDPIFPKLKGHPWAIGPSVALVSLAILWLFVLSDLIFEQPLKIVFEADSSLCVDDHYGLKGTIFYQNRRVKITSSDAGQPRLRVPIVELGGRNVKSVYLSKYRADQPDEFHADDEGFWNVVQLVSTEPTTIKLLHSAGNSVSRHLGSKAQFEVIASIEKHQTCKLVQVEIDDRGKLLFHMT